MPSIKRGIVEKVGNHLVAFLLLSTESPSFVPTNSTEDVTILSSVVTEAYLRFIEEVKSQLLISLPTYMVPRYFLPISRIPTIGMGKADRKLLRALAETIDIAKSSSTMVKQVDDEWHGGVRQVWAKVLKMREEEIGDDDTFTRLGGDSIGFMRAVALLRNNYSVSFANFISASSLSDFAEILRRSPPKITSTAIDYTPFSLIDPAQICAIMDELSTDYQISSSDIQDIYPTSPSQDSLLAASIDSSRYYAQAVYEIESTISLDVLRSALKELVFKHDSLRTCFLVVDVVGTIQIVLKKDNDQVTRCIQCEVIEVAEDRLEQEISVRSSC